MFFNSGRGEIREWMENREFVQLHQWLEQCKEQIEILYEAGEVPVVGWKQLGEIIKNYGARKYALEAELDQNERECAQLGEQIAILLEKQDKLTQKKQQLQEEMRKVDEIIALEAESQSIALLGNKEQASLVKLEEKMKNAYFMEELDSEDISTVFSMFNMDSLFSTFKKNDMDNNLGVTTTATVAELQTDLELEFSETVELLWKLTLLKNGEKGAETHLSKCSICSSTKLGVLLQEYGMGKEEIKTIEESIKPWKGYYVPTANARSAALELNLTGDLRPKFTTCWTRIQNVHKWVHTDE